jgi:hypothetical protein
MEAGYAFKTEAGFEDTRFIMGVGPEMKSGLSTMGRKP